MQDLQYIGEHLLPGKIAHFCLILSFCSAIFGALAYFFATQNKIKQTDYSTWKSLGRAGFLIHGVTTLSLIAIIFYIMYKQYYEYSYVFNHVSSQLPMRYILSAFWEGQEGSFLLWMFWHIVLAAFFVFRKHRFEMPVLVVILAAEAFLMSMILGLYIPYWGGEIKIGSNPILLLRDVMDIPLFAQANYLEKLDGEGLNVLLQNYWMTIHPPTLFLGFASTIIPFALAIASLWTRDYKSWLTPTLRWSLFSGAVLGTGIFMGGLWAYEALSFGGYWAWDPVENTSLVPWMILVAGIHTNLIAKKTGHSLRPTYIFYILSFLFILYSTFLTRSGILGDTSVHSFTELGLEKQLVIFIFFFLMVGSYLFFSRYKSIPAKEPEEKVNSREFWMFIGSIVIFFGAMLITFSSSLPVYNVLYQWWIDPTYLGSVIKDPMEHYNKYQLWIGVFIALLSSIAQYLRYSGRNWEEHKTKFAKSISIATLLSIAATFLLSQYINIPNWQAGVFLFSGCFGVITNLDYLLFYTKKQSRLFVSVCAHLGFAILIFGILLTGLNKEVITSNHFAMKGLVDDDKLRENIALIKELPLYANGYWFRYLSDTLVDHDRIYTVQITKLDGDQNPEENVLMYPTAVYDKRFEKVVSTNPDAKHYLTKDIFTQVDGLPSHLSDIDSLTAMKSRLKYVEFEANIGDTFKIFENKAVITGLHRSKDLPEVDIDEVDLSLSAEVKIISDSLAEEFTLYPSLVLQDKMLSDVVASNNPLGLRMELDVKTFDNMYTQEHLLDYKAFQLKEGESIKMKDWDVTLQGFDRNPDHPDYQDVEGDVALGANLRITNGQKTIQLHPIFVVRGKQVFELKDYDAETGLHVKFVNINPSTATMDFVIAEDDRSNSPVTLQVANRVPRSDVMWLKTTIFPGINLVWLGCGMMLFGLFWGMWLRRQDQ